MSPPTGDPHPGDPHPGDPQPGDLQRGDLQPGEPAPEASAAGIAYAVADEYDMPAEVDATFRTLRRVATGYFAVFLVVILAVPGLTLALDWWSAGRLIGGMSPSFVMAAFGLYVFFFVLAVAFATLAGAVEQRMLGGSQMGGPELGDPELGTPGLDDPAAGPAEPQGPTR